MIEKPTFRVIKLNDKEIQIIQSYKNCSCSTTGKINNQLYIHKRCKAVCGEDCGKYKMFHK